MKITIHLFMAIALVPFLTLAARVAGASPQNQLIPLSGPAAVEPVTDPLVFDSTRLFSPDFSINQNDPALKDLFNSKGQSNLCWPSSFAEILVYLKAYANPLLTQLNLPGTSADGSTVDPNVLVRSLAKLCHTSAEDGTNFGYAFTCTRQIFAQAGYTQDQTRVISPALAANSPGIESRPVTLQDIRTALDAGHPVILEAGWYSYNAAQKKWLRQSGHIISVYGYDYDSDWNEEMMLIKAVDPEIDYNTAIPSAAARITTLTLSKIDAQPGVIYPDQRPYILSGSDFSGATKRGFVGGLIEFAPK